MHAQNADKTNFFFSHEKVKNFSFTVRLDSFRLFYVFIIVRGVDIFVEHFWKCIVKLETIPKIFFLILSYFVIIWI